MKKVFRYGLVWGLVPYLITMLAFPLLQGEKLSVVKLLLGIPLWIVTGFAMASLFGSGRVKKKR